MNKWSETAWQAVEPVYRRIIIHPFVRELAAGTLPRQKFKRYLQQDALYLENYSRVLAHIASRLKAKDEVEDFLRFAIDGIEVERGMHSEFLGGHIPSRQDMSEACMLYTSVLAARAMGCVEAEAASVLPCFWVYRRVGQEIIASARPDNPYSRWIETYADPAFEHSTRRAIDICDRLAAEASDAVRDEMTYWFTVCTRLEWKFWDSAYNMEEWKI